MIIEVEATILCGMTYYKKDAKGQPTNELGAVYSFLYDDEDTSKNALCGSIMQAYGSKDLCADPVKLTYLRNLKRFSRVKILVNAPVGKTGLFVLNDVIVGAPVQQNVAPQTQPMQAQMSMTGAAPQYNASNMQQSAVSGMQPIQDDGNLPF